MHFLKKNILRSGSALHSHEVILQKEREKVGGGGKEGRETVDQNAAKYKCLSVKRYLLYQSLFHTFLHISPLFCVHNKIKVFFFPPVIVFFSSWMCLILSIRLFVLFFNI